MKLRFVYMLIGVVIMGNILGCADRNKYELYASKNKDFGVTVSYLTGWAHFESRGSYGSYDQLLFAEPKQDEGVYRASISVTAYDMTKMKIKDATLEGVVSDLIEKRMKFKDAKVLFRKNTKVMGLPAVDVLISYKAMAKIYSPGAKMVDVKERAVIFLRDNKAVFIDVKDSPKKFDKLNSAFGHIVKSLKFK